MASCSVGTGGKFFRGLKQSGCKADHLVAPSAEVKNEWSQASICPYAFMGVYREKLISIKYVTQEKSTSGMWRDGRNT